ncbi:hypothetical protein Psfp_00707 [Pelotomaculum sp. FP]|nr:hypothetical protein Psfp_00707 [Pelotomaculum sp. FP]
MYFQEGIFFNRIIFSIGVRITRGYRNVSDNPLSAYAHFSLVVSAVARIANLTSAHVLRFILLLPLLLYVHVLIIELDDILG